MKMRKAVREAAAMVFAAVLTVCAIPAGKAQAAPGDIGQITMRDTGVKYAGGAEVNGRDAGGAGKEIHRIFVDGATAFCIQPGAPLSNGVQLKESASDVWNALSEGQRKAVGVMLLFGYQGNAGALAGSDDEKWLATQALVWEVVSGCRSVNPPYERTIDTIFGIYFGDGNANAGVKAVYDQIAGIIATQGAIPSFMSVSPGGASVELAYQDGAYSVTLTDHNGVLPAFHVASSDSSVQVLQSGNTLTISTNAVVSGSVQITAVRSDIPHVAESARLIAYGDNSLQDLVAGAENVGGVNAYLTIGTPAGNVSIKKTSEDGKVSGIRFHIAGNGVGQDVTTAGDGTIAVNGLAPGVYTVTEQAIDRYEPQNTQRVTVTGGQTATVTFNNVLKRGTLTVSKTAEDGLAEGLRFHLYGASLSGAPVDEYAVTDAEGKAVFRDILIGTGYTLEEADTPVRYVIPDTQTAAVEWNKVTEKSVHNVLKKWKAVVTKSDRETGTPQGDARLSGAVYGVYQGDTLVDTYTTDADGQFETKYYVCGNDWTVREIEPSEGYLLDETIYHVGAEPELYTVEYNTTANDVTEQVIKGNLAVIKHTDDGETQIETPENGAVFAVYLRSSGSYEAARESERDVLTCNENGFAQSKDLPYGVYTVQQTSGWEGRELMKPFDVYISENGQTYRYLINNGAFRIHVRIVKKDVETGKTIPYAGAGFQLYAPDGSQITQTFTYPEVTVLDTFYTNEEGFLITPEKLEYGKGYSLVEVQAPYGYVLDVEPVLFDVAEEHAEETDGITVIEVVKSNMPQKGIIRIEKTGEVFASVTESGGAYQPLYEVRGLHDAVYGITAKEDIITPDGTLRYEAGSLVDTVTTDESGKAESIPLHLGSYEVREITPPYGMVLNEEAHTVELSYAGQEVEITETGTGFYNERQKAAVSIAKMMEQDATFFIGMSGEVTAVTFGLYAAEELTALDGAVVPADGLIEVVSFDIEGRGMVQTDLPLGSYYLKELTTDSHYAISEETYPFTFAYGGEDVPVVEIAVNDGKAMENRLVYGSVRGQKTDDEGEALPGAVIGIFHPDAETFTSGKAILTVTSGADGGFLFEKVPCGTWVIREISAPEGYVLSECSCEVVVSGETEAAVTVEIANTLIRGAVQITKRDKEHPDRTLRGAVFEVFRDTNGDGKLDADDEKIGVLTDMGAGIYEMQGLIYGSYFLKEKEAPKGYRPDENAYPFEIREHGQTVIVENEEGKGFVNKAETGTLHIVKTSSDKKISGFSFCVTGPNGYEQVFTTAESGEIVIGNLRTGEYRISEVADNASSAYILPADKTVTVSADAVVKVEMHNELRDTPKTGDDRKPGHLIAIMALAAIGFGACTIGAVRKKKRREK